MMKKKNNIERIVKRKYNQIAREKEESDVSSCCGTSNCGEEVVNLMHDDYTDTEGHAEEADLGLGCGLPTEYAGIQPGDTVVDLGSGAGNDCFVARHETGKNGRVIGIDFADRMIEKARRNAGKRSFENVEFIPGNIEDIPLKKGTADVVISNCVLNLLPDKSRIFHEIHRVLKPGGHFSISDIVLDGHLPEGMREDAELYAGCVSGAIQKHEYLELIERAGFSDIEVLNEKHIEIPREIVQKYRSSEEAAENENMDAGLLSITVYGRKEG